MQLSISMAFNASAELAASDAFGYGVRVMYVSETSAAAPATDLAKPSIAWSRASGAVMGQSSWAGFSATCWFFGRDLFTSLGSAVPIGLIESCVGGTAIRQWVPQSGLARCPQPYNSPVSYGIAPYGHSLLYNGMIAPLTTGPTSITSVLWDQAESDSFPQTPPGYYTCQTVSHVNAWRAAWRAPLLPWIFMHLQPYTGSGPCCLEDLRSEQLAALALPAVGYASAIDLGDTSSPYGNVHFQNKQAAGARAVAAELAVAYGAGGASSSFPPPAFLSQVPFFNATSGIASMDVTLDGAGADALSMLPAANVTCPAGINATNCSGFAILGSDGASYAASASLGANGVLTITSSEPLPATVYGVGSSYAWAMWPLVSLYYNATPDAIALPVLPWRQALTLPGAPGPRPARVRYHYQSSGLCLSTNATAAYPCPGGWGNSCPAFLADCTQPQSVWLETPTALVNEALQSLVGGDVGINIDCDRCEGGRVAKVTPVAGDNGVAPNFADGQFLVQGCAGLCLDGGQGPAVPTCEPGEATAAAQVQLAPCTDASTQGWAREQLNAAQNLPALMLATGRSGLIVTTSVRESWGGGSLV